MRLIDLDSDYIQETLYRRGFKTRQDIEEWLNFAPTIDTVPVVRCKDCKYYEIHKPKVLENCERKGYIIPMKPDDFCSYGERKEGADND